MARPDLPAMIATVFLVMAVIVFALAGLLLTEIGNDCIDSVQSFVSSFRQRDPGAAPKIFEAAAVFWRLIFG